MSIVLKPIIPVFGPILRRGAALSWSRPADWLVMPTTSAQKIDVLAAVTNDDSNYVALSVTVTGGYSVDWGDGTVNNVASGATAEHKYTYSSISGSTLTSRGYKQAVVQITPQVGGNAITAFDLGKNHSRSGLGTTHSQPWLDIQINTPSATTMAVRSTLNCEWLERVNILAIGTITTLANAFYLCYSLQSVSFPAGSLASVTTLASAFQQCYSLQSVSFPAGSLASVTTLANAFNQCYSLQSVSFPAGSLASVTTLANAFYLCYSLQSVSFPAGSLASVTTLATAFYLCSSLQSVSFPAGSLASVTTLASAFYQCSSLQSVSFPAGSLASVTTLASAFQQCSSLQSVSFPAGSLASVTTLASAFYQCYSLQSVSFPAGSLASVTTLASAFQQCYSLQSVSFPAGSLASVTDTTAVFANAGNISAVTNLQIPVTFSVASNKLAGVELDAIYTSLPTVTGKTITVTGNHGTADHTPSIATAKGWTVTA